MEKTPAIIPSKTPRKEEEGLEFTGMGQHRGEGKSISTLSSISSRTHRFHWYARRDLKGGAEKLEAPSVLSSHLLQPSIQ